MASSRCRHPLELFDTAVRGEFKRRSEARAGTWKRAKKYQFLVFLEFLKSSLLKKSFKMTLIIMKSVVAEVKCVPDHERCHCDIEPAGFKVKGIVNNLQKVTATSFN